MQRVRGSSNSLLRGTDAEHIAEQFTIFPMRLRRHFPAVPIKVIFIDVPGDELPEEVEMTAEEAAEQEG